MNDSIWIGVSLAKVLFLPPLGGESLDYVIGRPLQDGAVLSGESKQIVALATQKPANLSRFVIMIYVE